MARTREEQPNAITLPFLPGERSMVKLRGKGKHLRMIGKFRGKNGPHTADGHKAPPDILHGAFRGQRVRVEPIDE